MAEPEEIHARIEAALGGTAGLRGKRVLVSAGGTREPLDAVRFVGNRSSGRMGVALAEEARRRGADVTLLAANLAVAAPSGVTVVETPTAADVEREALARSDADVIVMAAAVSDYRPATPSEEKRAKDGSGWTVELEPTADVLAAIGAARTDRQVIVGFAADRGEPRARSRPGEAGREERRPLRLQRREPGRHRVRRDATTRSSSSRATAIEWSKGRRSRSLRPLSSTRWSGYSRRHDRRRARGWACRLQVGGRGRRARRREPPAGRQSAPCNARALRAVRDRRRAI